MLRVLSGPERDVLLAHERAHAAGSHYLFTSAARLAAAANPLLRPVAAQVCYTVERWADERAATATGNRPLAARAIARAALASSAAPPDREGPLAVLGIVTPEDAERDHVRHRFRGPGLRGPARCPDGWPRCSGRRRAPACCWSARPWCSSPSPGCPPWTRPLACTPSSNWPRCRARRHLPLASAPGFGEPGS